MRGEFSRRKSESFAALFWFFVLLSATAILCVCGQIVPGIIAGVLALVALGTYLEVSAKAVKASRSQRG